MAVWSTERFTLFMKLWSEGLSASRIASAINISEGVSEENGITRCSVIGKMNRVSKVSGKPAGRNPLKGACERSIRVASAASKSTMADKGLVKLLGSKESTVHIVNSVLALKNNQCRFPIGNLQDLEFTFCNRAKVSGKSYCEHHAGIAYVKWKPKQLGSKPKNYSLKKDLVKAR
jgi:GcrA cell cycle regulator